MSTFIIRKMKRIINIIFALSLLFSITGCFRDLGNYDYSEVNEAVIGDRGFTAPYDVRIGIDRLKIDPDISFSQDRDGSGDYSYEWVAVGQNFHRGERFVIGTERSLDYKVELSAEEYILYLKVRDNATDIVFSRSVGLNVRGLYSVGWLFAGEDESGNGQMDMVSISTDVLFLPSVLKPEDGLALSPISSVWIDNDEYTSDGRLYAGTAEGSYKFDREEFSGSQETSIRYSFAIPPAADMKLSMTDNQKVSDVRQVMIVDRRAYIVSTDGGMIYNTFSNYDQLNDFNTADRMICNHTGVQGIRTFIFYDLDSRRFCYIKGLSVNRMLTQGDQDDDAWSWDTRNDFDGGLEFVTAFNSFFSGGQGAAILKDGASGRHYIYCMTAPRTGDPVKNGRYEVIREATGFADAAGYIITTNHGYMIYAAGNRLYGYDFRKESPTVTELCTFDAPVTCLKADYETSEKWNDVFYAATYDDEIPRSGKVYKFRVSDDPTRIEITQESVWDRTEGDKEQGFLKIHSIYYKAF